MPPFAVKIKPLSNLGRFARISSGGIVYTASVIDLVAGTNRPKRMRIQQDNRFGGDVRMLGEYKIMEWL